VSNHLLALWLSSHDGDSRVSLISGGGAGHEPAHAAFVGDSLLTGAVSGNIFASPSVRQILSCIESVGGSKGVLLILKNYTGDVFHFSLAAEKAGASLGLKVDTLIVGDDVSVGRKKSGKVGRRGLAGTVLVHKVLGGMAVEGKPLAKIKAAGEKLVAGLATVGVSLDHVHIPGHSANGIINLKTDEVELGMGIHNEPGCKLLSPRPTLSSLLDTMLAQILDPSDVDRAYVDFKDAKHTVLLVNNLGGLSVLELSAITTNVVRKLGKALNHRLLPVADTYR
jgi:dihydroxyacetone kinase